MSYVEFGVSQCACECAARVRSFASRKVTSSRDPLHHTAGPVRTDTEEIPPTPPGFQWTAVRKQNQKGYKD